MPIDYGEFGVPYYVEPPYDGPAETAPPPQPPSADPELPPPPPPPPPLSSVQTDTSTFVTGPGPQPPPDPSLVTPAQQDYYTAAFGYNVSSVFLEVYGRLPEPGEVESVQGQDIFELRATLNESLLEFNRNNNIEPTTAPLFGYQGPFDVNRLSEEEYNRQVGIATLTILNGGFPSSGYITSTGDERTGAILIPRPDGATDVFFPNGTAVRVPSSGDTSQVLNSYSGPSTGNYGVSDSAIEAAIYNRNVVQNPNDTSFLLPPPSTYIGTTIQPVPSQGSTIGSGVQPTTATTALPLFSAPAAGIGGAPQPGSAQYERDKANATVVILNGGFPSSGFVSSGFDSDTGAIYIFRPNGTTDFYFPNGEKRTLDQSEVADFDAYLRDNPYNGPTSGDYGVSDSEVEAYLRNGTVNGIPALGTAGEAQAAGFNNFVGTGQIVPFSGAVTPATTTSNLTPAQTFVAGGIAAGQPPQVPLSFGLPADFTLQVPQDPQSSSQIAALQALIGLNVPASRTVGVDLVTFLSNTGQDPGAQQLTAEQVEAIPLISAVTPAVTTVSSQDSAARRAQQTTVIQTGQDVAALTGRGATVIDPTGLSAPFAAQQQNALETNTGIQPTLQARNKQAASSDWRVRLQLAPSANYLYNATDPGILRPLAETDGVIFPYTPTIETTYNAQYETYDLVHSNYRGYFYKGSRVNEIQLRCTFTAQDTQEATYLLAVIHFFRSVTKMFYGSRDEFRGTPPPLCYLSGYGDFQFNQHTVLVSQFNYSLPSDVDYIRARIPNNYGTNLFTQRPRTGGLAPNPATAGLRRLLGTPTQPPVGAVFTPPAPPMMAANVNNLERATYVPTKMEISITLLPYNTRSQVSSQFNLKDFAAGQLIKGGFW